ncbi:hypothetical protein AnigIFM59636_001690 [Aspergillus niger]|nr:hypothetical protein AnigIFM59636_001690 [Aspergillus niger]
MGIHIVSIFLPYTVQTGQRDRKNDVVTGDGVRQSPDDLPRPGERNSWTLEIAQYGNGAMRNAVLASKLPQPHEDVRLIGSLGPGADRMASDTVASIEARLELEHNASVVLVPQEMLDKHCGHYCHRLAWAILNS